MHPEKALIAKKYRLLLLHSLGILAEFAIDSGGI